MLILTVTFVYLVNSIQSKLEYPYQHFRAHKDANYDFQPELPNSTFVTQIMTTSRCSTEQSYMEKCKNDPNEINCKGLPNQLICTTISEINDALLEVNSKCDKLIIYHDGDLKIEFERLGHIGLKDRISVEVYNNILSPLPVLQFRGRIYFEIKSLYVTNMILKSPGEEIVVDDLYLYNSYIDPDSGDNQCFYLMVDEDSHSLLQQYSEGKNRNIEYTVKSDKYYDNFLANNEIQYRISFEETQWRVERKNKNQDSYSQSYFENIETVIPYTIPVRLGIFAISHYFDFHIESNSIYKINPVNVSIIYPKSYKESQNSKILEDEKFLVTFTTSGDWTGLGEKYEFFLSCFPDYVTLNTDGCNEYITTTIVNLSEYYIPKVLEPDEPSSESETTNPNDDDETDVEPSHIPISVSPSEINDLGTVSSSSNSFISDINTKFDEVKNDKNADHVITILGNEINLDNLELEPNNYIRLAESGAKINLISGSLNLYINESSSKININLINENNQFSIKSASDCNLVFNTEQKKDIYLSSNSDISNTLNLNIGDNIQTFKINSVQLHDSGSINSDKSIIIEEVEAKQNLISSLTNVVVENIFNIEQLAKVKLNNVHLDNANININMQTYQKYGFEEPLFEGELYTPPSKMVINKPTDGSQLSDGAQYIIFKGTFNGKCDDWNKKLDIDQTSFNEKKCIDYDDNKRLSEEKKALIVTKNKQDNDNKLTSGQIAGIVIGCIAGVAIIVIIIVVVIIKKKKNNQNSSAENGKEDQQDDL